MHEILNDVNLLKKYDVYAYDYTDYPHKSYWSEDLGDKDYRNTLKSIFLDKNHAPALFYIHVPFCKKLCYYCICHKEIAPSYDKVLKYFENYLYVEIDMLRRLFEENSLRPNFKEIYIGGGTPTLLEEKEFDRLMALVGSFCDIKNMNRFCIEIDPRVCSVERLKYYAKKGVTTISIGVQDLDINVQRAINRTQSPEMIEKLLSPEIRKTFSSINFDLLIGLPNQTRTSIRKTMEKVISMAPDRISMTYFHYAPKFYPHMKKLKERGLLPDSVEKKHIFAEGLDAITKNGYVRTGFEHFAKPGDVVAEAVRMNKANYTSLGAVSGDCCSVVAVGRSGHGMLGDSYLFQNHYEQEQYGIALSRGKFPIYRGHKMSADDVLRRDIIKGLRTYFVINIPEVENRINTHFSEYFSAELDVLNEFIKDGLAVLTREELKITERGKHFSGLIASIFDKYQKSPRCNKEVASEAMSHQSGEQVSGGC